MSTIDSLEIIDKIVAGNGFYPGDEDQPPVVRIVIYKNLWGGVSYGTEGPHDYGKYKKSPYVRDPVVYWEMPNWRKKYGHR